MPYHHIPGYTGHLPQNRERFGVNYREASAATIANQRSKGVFNPVTPMEGSPNHVSKRERERERCGALPRAAAARARRHRPSAYPRCIPPHRRTPRPTPRSQFQGFDPDVDALGRKPAKYSEKFVSARQLSESEGTGQQTAHDTPHAQAPFGVYPTATATGQMDYQTTSSLVAPNNQPPPAGVCVREREHPPPRPLYILGLAPKPSHPPNPQTRWRRRLLTAAWLASTATATAGCTAPTPTTTRPLTTWHRCALLTLWIAEPLALPWPSPWRRPYP